jgi:hypothetical protein
LYLISHVYSKKAVFDHSQAFALRWLEWATIPKAPAL